MASITVRNLDEGVKKRLRVRAADNGRSMEEEVRLILREAVEPETGEENTVEEQLLLAGPCREVYADWHDDPAKRRTDMYRLLA